MPTDCDLIRQTLKGNQCAFGELVRKYQSVIYAHALRQVHNPQDAEELTQDVFLKAYQNLNQLRDADRFAGWLVRIVSNECASWLRQHGGERQACEVDSDLLSELPSRDAAPDGALIQRELRQAILQAIDSLPALDRAVAKSFYIDQLSYEEISDQHGLSHSAIASRLHKAKGRIAQKVKQSLSSFVWMLQHGETLFLGGTKTMPVILMKAISWIAAVGIVGFGTTPLLNWFDELTQEQDKGIILTLLDSEKDAAEKPKIEPKKKEEEKPEVEQAAQKQEREETEQQINEKKKREDEMTRMQAKLEENLRNSRLRMEDTQQQLKRLQTGEMQRRIQESSKLTEEMRTKMSEQLQAYQEALRARDLQMKTMQEQLQHLRTKDWKQQDEAAQKQLKAAQKQMKAAQDLARVAHLKAAKQALAEAAAQMKENGAEVEASRQALKQAEQALEEAIKALEKAQKMEPKKSEKTEELPDL